MGARPDRRQVLTLAGLATLAGCAPHETAGAGGESSGTSTATSTPPPPTSATPTPTAATSSSGSPVPVATTSPRPTPSPTPEPSGTGTPLANPRELVFVASGDLLWHNSVYRSAQLDQADTGRGIGGYDFDPMFAALRPIISGADLAAVQNEVPFAAPGAQPEAYPVFAAPSSIAQWMPSMGWDLAVTASNHSLDQGFEGLVRTHQMLTTAKIQPIGTHPSAAQQRSAQLVERRGGKVAVVAGTYGLNGFVTPAGKSWCVDMWDTDRMIADARVARAAGADIVIAHLHGGEEYNPLPTSEQVTRAHALAKAPEIDLVYGEHAHVVQPITQVDGTWVVYGLGNLVAQHRSNVPRGYEGITIRARFVEQQEPRPGKLGRFAVQQMEYIPTLITSLHGDGRVRVLPVKSSLASGKGPTDRLNVALARTRQAVHALGGPAAIEA